MWIADQWKDYEVIDTSKGEKLERWGNYLLVRPDPQVIWDTPRTHKGWSKPNAHDQRSSKGGGQWEFFDLPEQWSIRYRELTFQLKPFSFKHTGTGRELGLVLPKNKKRRQAYQGSEPFCLHRRSHAGSCGCRSQCNPCGCLQGNGSLGKGKCPLLRP